MEELHKCKYCEVETTQPDKDCYANDDKELTAVEWVIQYLNNVKPHEFCSIETIKKILEQALEMEKQQIKNAFIEGHNVCRCVTDNGSQVYLVADLESQTFKLVIT